MLWTGHISGCDISIEWGTRIELTNVWLSRGILGATISGAAGQQIRMDSGHLCNVGIMRIRLTVWCDGFVQVLWIEIGSVYQQKRLHFG